MVYFEEMFQKVHRWILEDSGRFLARVPTCRWLGLLCSHWLIIPFVIIDLNNVDINKFLWMVRIGGSTDTGRHIKETDYYTPQGEFRVDREGSPTLLNCLMYKMCYYRFGKVYTESGKINNTLFIIQFVQNWGRI